MVTVTLPRLRSPIRRKFTTLADVQQHVGGVPIERIIATPAPGTATEEDLLAVEKDLGLSCELFDGILVAKPMGRFESLLSMVLGQILLNYLDKEPLGFVTGEDDPVRVAKGRVRKADLGFYLNENLPADVVLTQISDLPPDLAIEIISPSNTVREMDLKLEQYFKAGASLAWYIYPPTKTAKLFTSPKKFVEIDASGYPDGRDLLPGFRVRLGELFERAERLMKPRAGRKTKKK